VASTNVPHAIERRLTVARLATTNLSHGDTATKALQGWQA
jgi:hypothetical protein